MTQLLIRLFVRHPDDTKNAAVRTAYGNLASLVGMACNILLCLGKLTAGTLFGSIAIMADALNNLSDASSNVVSLVGFRLAAKGPDEKHPYGHARYEYLAGLVVCVTILAIGLSLLKESALKVLHPTAVVFSWLSVGVLAASILVKLWMSRFNKTIGQRINSETLMATAADSRNDVLTTSAVLLSTVLSRLNAFLDTELEQVICYDSPINAEMFASEKCAIFLILPEEDPAKNFIAGLMIQNLSRELFAVADENGGKLKNRVILFCDELGTMPPFDILPLFSAGRSRRLTLVPIIQSLAQLEKNYGKEGASILMDNCQDVICGGFAPNSEAADAFSKALGSRTVLSGSVSRGKNDPSQSLQMMERPLLTADELKSIPKGSFIVQKTGCHPMRTRLRLFLEWGITFEEEYRVEEQAARKVYYADQNALTRAIVRKYPPKLTEQKTTRSVKGEGQLRDAPAQEMVVAEDIDYDRMPHKRTPYNLPRQEVDR